MSKLKREGIIECRTERRRYYYSLKNPKKLTEEERQTQLYDLKPPLSPSDKTFINKLSCLYLQYGNLNIAAKKMKIDRNALLAQIDSILKTGALTPIKTRKELIPGLRIKRDYDRTGTVYQTAKRYGFSGRIISQYLKHGDKAGLFKYPEPIKKRKYKIKPVITKQAPLAKSNINAILKLKREYDRLGSIKKIGKKHGLSHENIRLMLMAGNDLGLFEFPVKKKRLYAHITKEKLEADFLKYESMPKLSRHYGVSIGRVKEAIKNNISPSPILCLN